MKFREVVIYSGETLQVPQCIQRIDHRATHGWQVRYGGTKLFSDGSGSAAASLEAATKELIKRINKLPAPSLLQKLPNANKTSALPVGISGPLEHQRRGSHSYDYSLGVLQPRFGGKARLRTVYIGTSNTYTDARFDAALEKAIKLRNAAEEAYEKAATRARREAARALKNEMNQGAS